MMIHINGSRKEIPDGSTVERLFEIFGLERKSTVFELNRKVVRRHQYSDLTLQEGDSLEIVHFVGGG